MIANRSAVIVLALLVAGCGPTPSMSSGGRSASYWESVLKGPDVSLRRKAAVKLGPLLLLDSDALPAMVAALNDKDAEVRSAAARALGIYSGPRAAEVLPALRERRNTEKDPSVQAAASKAIEMLSGEPGQ